MTNHHPHHPHLPLRPRPHLPHLPRLPRRRRHPATAAATAAFATGAATALSSFFLLPSSFCSDAPRPNIARPNNARPNIVLIVTDDQGYAELGITGNPVVRTPNIDRFARQGVSLGNFYVMPVCSPTRACLMTGRYFYRTGLTDTWNGSSLVDPSETTIAQMLAAAGYRTGIFGKWHLGDNYPRRAMDKGFQESLVLNGGGLAQPGDPPDPADERGAYFNATLRHNGQWVKTDGYVSDVITTAAMRFIEQSQARYRDKPFFVYLPFNCPHSPHQVPDEYREHYPPAALAPAKFPKAGNPMPAKQNPADIARVYGMVENIDDNVGRLLAQLDKLNLAADTIVVLFSDNGCQQHNGYNGGLRGWKGSPFEGGTRQFCFLRWPGHFEPGASVAQLSCVIDIAPTLLDLAGLAGGTTSVSSAASASLGGTTSVSSVPSTRARETDDTEVVPPGRAHPFDGLSLAPLLRAAATAAPAVVWPDRPIVTQWHRGLAPERYRCMSIRQQNWKLVQPLGGGNKWDGKTDFMLFDIAADPYEQHNLAAQRPERVAALKKAYDAWFDDILRSHDFSKPQRITIGVPQENPVLLTRQDWRDSKMNWSNGGHGHWELTVATAARYDIKVLIDAPKEAGEVSVTLAGVTVKKPVEAGDEELVFKNVALPAGDGRLEVTVKLPGAERGARYVEITRRS